MRIRLNIPPFTRAILVCVIGLSILNTVIRFRSDAPILSRNPIGVPFITIIPRDAYKTPWTFITTSFVEQNLFSLAISCVALFFGGRYLERAWGGSEYAKFVFILAIVPNILSTITYVLWYLLSGNTLRIITTIHGAIAVEAGFLVAFKQLVPEHTVSLFKSIIRIRVKHFPAIFVALNIISGPLLGTDTALFLSFYGFLTSWIYLRFFRKAPSLLVDAGDTVVKGDASETFAFVQFFPDSIQAIISPLVNSIWKLMVGFKVIVPFSEEAIEAGNVQASARAENGLPNMMNNMQVGEGAGGRREEAERRRAITLKALDQRLSAAAGRSTTAPSATVQQSVKPTISSEEKTISPVEAESKPAETI